MKKIANERTNEQKTNEWANVLMNEQTNKWMKKTIEWTNEQMNEQMN
jgi:hypothetical protein